MYFAIRQYNMAVKKLDQGVLDRIANEFVPILKSIPGFHAYHVIDTGDYELVTVSAFETEEGEVASTDASAEWVGNNLTHLVAGTPTIISGEGVLNSK